MLENKPGPLVSEGRKKRPGHYKKHRGVAKLGTALDFDSRKFTLRWFESSHPYHTINNNGGVEKLVSSSVS